MAIVKPAESDPVMLTSLVIPVVNVRVANPGSVTTLPINVTAVCASALPFSTAPLSIAMFVAHSMFPLNTELANNSTP